MPTQSWANRSSVLVVCWYLVAEASCTPHPLAAFIFSRDKAAIDRFIGELSFGGGAVNQVNINLFIETMPFGGVGPSGMGHYYGKHGFDMLTHAKLMLISPPDVVRNDPAAPTGQIHRLEQP